MAPSDNVNFICYVRDSIRYHLKETFTVTHTDEVSSKKETLGFGTSAFCAGMSIPELFDIFREASDSAQCSQKATMEILTGVKVSAEDFLEILDLDGLILFSEAVEEGAYIEDLLLLAEMAASDAGEL